jgi:cbb3-type cytochrome oxidase maturation protein
MSVILVLVVFSVTVAIVFLIAFFWSVRNGQYDDTYSSSVRILFEDDKPPQSDTGASSPENNLKEQSPNK